MTWESTSPPQIAGVELLERAINYGVGTLQLVRSQSLSAPTPCSSWDLQSLLHHVADSLIALREAAEGTVGLEGPVRSADPPLDPVAEVKRHACGLLGAWANSSSGDDVDVSGPALTRAILASTGAVEISVHAWDIAHACRNPRPIPGELAEELLELAPFFVTPADRPTRFGAPVPVPAQAHPGDRLVAFLGRRPAV